MLWLRDMVTYTDVLADVLQNYNLTSNLTHMQEACKEFKLTLYNYNVLRRQVGDCFL